MLLKRKLRLRTLNRNPLTEKFRAKQGIAFLKAPKRAYMRRPAPLAADGSK